MRYLRRNVFLVYAVYGVTLVSGLVVTPIIIREIGTEEYGLWSFIGSLAVFLALLDFGLGPSVIRHAAEQRGRGAAEETNALASTGLAIYGVISLVTIAIAAVLVWVLPALIDVRESLVAPGRVALILTIAAFAARFPLGLFGNLLAAQQRYDLIHLGSLVAIVVYTLLVPLLLLTVGGGIVTLALVTLGTTVLRLALPLAWLRAELPSLRLRRSLVNRDGVRGLLGFSWHNFLIHVASKVVLSTDVIVVGIVLGSVAAGHYAAPAKLFALALGMGVSLGTLLFPVLSELEGTEDRAQQRTYLLGGIRISLAVVLLAAVPLALLPDAFLAAWLGAEYEDGGFTASVPVLVLLMASILFVQPSNLLTQFLIARSRHATLALARLATVAVNLVLSIVLAATVGLWGVAAATLATEAVAFAVVLPVLVRRASGIEARALAGAWLRPLVVAAVAAVPTLVLVGRAVPSDTLLGFAGVGLLWAAAFGALLWRFGLEDGERASVRRALGRIAAPPPTPAPAEEPS